ncbi:MAG: hypothetical protein DRN15_10105 [Thermoprotei archaeon]|nr:MAG: hypothetical protein DRN15_10105 [Thermoprotei archaeon]RLF25532.1 MAG: hypothetical protein DRM97_01485 [Thermoprotei archaeon]
MTIVYLDSSAIVKHYALEAGSYVVSRVYHRTLNEEFILLFSAWDIGSSLVCSISIIGEDG